MIKYTDTMVVFSEIPDKISIAVNITNCQNRCIGCHSPELRENIGTELTKEEIDKMIKENDGINCFLFMGEGNDRNSLLDLAKYIKEKYSDINVALYSGRESVENDFLYAFDYIKVGPYISEFGPLNKKTTNQKLYKKIKNYTIFENTLGFDDSHWIDITSDFWK